MVLASEGDLPNYRKAQSKLHLRQFVREFYFMSYVVRMTLSLNKTEKCGITTFTKICTNYVEDWNDIVRSQYSPQAGYTPNPFGMVTYISAPVFETPHTDSHHPDRFFIYDLEFLPQKVWWVEKTDRKKYVHALMDTNDLKAILRGVEDNEGRPSLPGPMSNKEISDAECLSKIYKHFKPVELNVLASHRDLQKSKECMAYVCWAWSYQFARLIEILKKVPENGIMEIAIRCADLCEQINVKMGLIKNEMPACIRKVRDIMGESIDERAKERPILEDIYDYLSENAPLNENPKYIDYFADLRVRYKQYREEVYPLTEAILEVVLDCCEGEIDLFAFDQKRGIDDALKRIRSSDAAPVFDVECDKKDIPQDIRTIEEEYSKLRNREAVFRYFERPLVSLEVRDGRDESW